VCAASAYPYVFAKQVVCVVNSKVSYLGLGSLVANCDKYSNDGATNCVQCAVGYVLDELSDVNNPACVNSCPVISSEPSYQVLDNLDGKVNVCRFFLQRKVDFCTQYARVSKYNQYNGVSDLDYRCV
jgi:ferredoxin